MEKVTGSTNWFPLPTSRVAGVCCQGDSGIYAHFTAFPAYLCILDSNIIKHTSGRTSYREQNRKVGWSFPIAAATTGPHPHVIMVTFQKHPHFARRTRSWCSVCSKYRNTCTQLHDIKVHLLTQIDANQTCQARQKLKESRVYKCTWQITSWNHD